MPALFLTVVGIFILDILLKKGIDLIQKLKHALSPTFQILVIVLGVLLLLAVILETLLVFGAIPNIYGFHVATYSIAIISFVLTYIILNNFVNRVALIESIWQSQLDDINKNHMIAQFDMDGNFISVNRNMNEVLGYNNSELLSHNYNETVPTYSRELQKTDEFWARLQTGTSIQGEFERLTAKKDPLWIQSSYTPLKDITGKYTSILEISSDKTHDHQAQLEIEQKNSYLEYAAKILRHDMHSGINTYIPRGLKALKRRLTQSQIDELGIAAPLKLIEGGLEHAQKVYAGVTEFANLVKNEAKIEKIELDLAVIIRNHISKSAYSKQVIIEDLVVANVNESLFCTAIANLIQNGLKYNDSKTRVVRLCMEGPATLCVIDNGIGMSQDEFEYFSKPYTRGSNDYHGSGLGLNICKAILNIHGFEITSEKMEIGTKLRIKLRS